MSPRAPLAGFIAAAMTCVAGCSLLLDWDLTGGAGDDAGGDASADVGSPEGSGESGSDAPAICSGSMSCVAAAPAGWSGPVELYSGATAQGAPPSCGSGFAATPVFDGNAGIAADPPTCSACGCGTPSGATCNGPVITFYVDDACSEEIPISPTQTVTSQCSTTNPVAASVTVAAVTASGGTCTGTGGVATTPAVTWSQVARACVPSSAPSASNCGAGRVCVPGPTSPFASSSCVFQAGVATACPTAYPSGPQLFYSGVDDERACSQCGCSAATGAACSIGTPAITNCLDGTTLDAPNGCATFTGGEPVKLANTPTVSTAGTCAVSGGGSPTGTATPTGATSFCCSP